MRNAVFYFCFYNSWKSNAHRVFASWLLNASLFPNSYVEYWQNSLVQKSKGIWIEVRLFSRSSPMIPVSFFFGNISFPTIGICHFCQYFYFLYKYKRKKKAMWDLRPLKRNARGSRETDLFLFLALHYIR